MSIENSQADQPSYVCLLRRQQKPEAACDCRDHEEHADEGPTVLGKSIVEESPGQNEDHDERALWKSHERCLEFAEPKSLDDQCRKVRNAAVGDVLHDLRISDR